MVIQMKKIKKAKNLLIMASCILMASLLVSCESDDGEDGGATTSSVAENPFAGNYSGTFSGGDTGTWSMKVASNGGINGRARSTVDGNSSTISGSLNNDGRFTAAVGGGTSDGSTWSGRASLDGSISGTWKSTIWNLSGSFSGNRN